MTMPDRAVVVCPKCDLERCEGGLIRVDGRDGKSRIESCPRCGRKPPQPRAIVALSDDHEWLAMLEPVDQIMMWGVFKRDWDDDKRPWAYESTMVDTGQDAHEVLAAWMEGHANV